jgi:hypothetical protein
MTTRRRHIADLPTTAPLTERGERTVIEVKLFYSEGGMNYATYKTEARGYYLSVTPVDLSDSYRKFAMFSGIKGLVEAVPRFNAKRLDRHAEGALTSQLYQALLAHVLTASNLTVAEVVQ